MLIEFTCKCHICDWSYEGSFEEGGPAPFGFHPDARECARDEILSDDKAVQMAAKTMRKGGSIRVECGIAPTNWVSVKKGQEGTTDIRVFTAFEDGPFAHMRTDPVPKTSTEKDGSEDYDLPICMYCDERYDEDEDYVCLVPGVNFHESKSPPYMTTRGLMSLVQDGDFFYTWDNSKRRIPSFWKVDGAPYDEEFEVVYSSDMRVYPDWHAPNSALLGRRATLSFHRGVPLIDGRRAYRLPTPLHAFNYYTGEGPSIDYLSFRVTGPERANDPLPERANGPHPIEKYLVAHLEGIGYALQNHGHEWN